MDSSIEELLVLGVKLTCESDSFCLAESWEVQ